MTSVPKYHDSYVTPVQRMQLGFEDAACALGLPLSTLEQLHRRGEGPIFFTVGRRKFTTENLIRQWQDEEIETMKNT